MCERLLATGNTEAVEEGGRPEHLYGAIEEEVAAALLDLTDRNITSDMLSHDSTLERDSSKSVVVNAKNPGSLLDKWGVAICPITADSPAFPHLGTWSEELSYGAHGRVVGSNTRVGLEPMHEYGELPTRKSSDVSMQGREVPFSPQLACPPVWGRGQSATQSR